MKKLLLAIICALSLLPSLANATTRYVDSTAGACTGNYSIASRNCTGSDGNSYANTTTGLAATASGDTLYIRTGTYTANILDTIPGGTVSGRTTISNYNSEIVTIRPAGSTFVIYMLGRQYVTIHGLILDGVNVSVDAIKVDTGSHNLIIEDCEIKNASHNIGVNIQGLSNNGIIRRNLIHDNALSAPSPDFGHGIYLQKGTGWLIEKNRLYHNGAYGLQIYPDNQGTTVRRNIIYDNGVITTPVSNVVLANTGHIFEYNVIYNNAITDNQYGLRIQFGSTAPANTIVRHNTLYNAGTTGIYVASNATGIKLQNNLIIGSTTPIDNLGTNTTQTTNRTSGTAATIFTNTATFDLSLKAGSAAINSGTDLGLPFNTFTGKTLPDQGAFETFGFSSGSVESATPTKLSVLFTNTLTPPLLPAASPGTFTARKAGVNDVVTASSVVGDNQIDLTLTTAIVAGNAVDISWASGNLTDSALVGNLLNQPYVQGLTNQSITNNTAGASTAVLTQSVFIFHALRGTEALPVGTPYNTAPSNSNIQVNVNGAVRLRIAVTCTTSLCAPVGFYPYYSKNGGAYTLVPDTYGSDQIGFCGTSPDADIPTSGAPTTSQIGAGTFSAGAFVRTSNAIPTVTFAAVPSKTELEYCFSFSTSAVAADTYDIRLRKQDGTVLDTYTVTPRMTIVSTSGGSGF